VKDNLISGKLNPEKFASLYDRMARKYDAEVLQRLMGFTSTDAFQKLYGTVKSSLPKELQDALDDVKDEIKTVDDLSLVLNRLFRDHGETLDSNMMVFSCAGVG
jgi:5,10-methylenetetrahydrofolate reductase